MRTRFAPVALLFGLLPITAANGGGPLAAGWDGTGFAIVEGRTAPAVPDTVLEARTGDGLVVETWMGSLSVRVGEADVVRVTGTETTEVVTVTRRGNQIRVVPARSDAEGDVVVEMPEWMALEVRSRSLDVDVDGLAGGVRVELFEGDVRLRRTRGTLDVETLDGEIEVRDIAGDVRLNALDGDIQLQRATGDRVLLQSADGELELDGVEASEVSAVTVDGDVRFRGQVVPGGSLTLTTHDGDVRAWLPADLDAEVQVSTFDGSFEADFPVRTRGFRAGAPLRFTLGQGGTQVVLESFDGDIRLLSW